jgi:hypothetical protein
MHISETQSRRRTRENQLLGNYPQEENLGGAGYGAPHAFIGCIAFTGRLESFR